ncbi:MAG: hypothetical protein KatS3mg050_3976 [Litorilinea sp.]|nr:MAG: hypothetical protein KatS3mg050_3976 [Litorilinea sp.]
MPKTYRKSGREKRNRLFRQALLWGWMVLLVGGLVVGCTPAQETGSEETQPVPAASADGERRRVAHAMGETQVPCTPQRVVTLGQGATDAVLALGLTPVGAVDPWGGKWYAYLGDRMADVPSVGSETEPNLETIVALDPDLILGSRLRHEAIYDQLSAIAPTVFAETIGKAWKENFQLYAQALCREEQGQELLAAWEARIADFQGKMGERLQTRVSLVRFRADEVRIYTTGFPGSVLREAGLSRPESQQVDDWENAPQVMTLSKEQIPLMDGDILFYMVSDWENNEGSQIQAEWTGHPLWQTLQVVQQGAVYPVNEEHWNLGGGILAANRMLDDLYRFFLGEEATEPAPATTAFPVTIEHKFGTTTIPQAPQRVVTVGFSEQDPVLALGVKPVAVREWFGEQPYAIWPWAQDELGDATPQVLRMPFGELNFEAIAALQPDLIVATHAGITQEEYDLLAQIAPTLAQSAAYPDFGMPWQEQTRIIGQALGRPEQAEAQIEKVEAQIAEAARQHPILAGKTVAWITPAGEPGQFWIVGPDTPPMRFLTALGLSYPDELRALVGELDSAQISSERLDLLDVDVLLVRAANEEERAAIEADPIFQSLGVFQDNRVIFFVGADDPIYGALSFSTVLSLPYALEELVPQLVQAVERS